MQTYKQFLNEAKYKQFYHPNYAYKLAKNIGHRLSKDEEDYIRTDPEIACLYAMNVIKGTWPEAEDEIASAPLSSFNYAKYVVKGRFPKGEDTLQGSKEWNLTYSTFLYNCGYGDAEKWKWLHTDLTENTVKVLNDLGMKSDMQEYILKTRPDLAGLIKNLKPKLRDKYKHELELGHVDV